MFYRHWKKFALALTAFFWASCGEDTPSPTGVSPDPESSSSGDTSSSSEDVSSSSAEESSSSYIPLSAPLYGVFQMDCNIVDMQNPTPGCADGSSSSSATSSSSAEESSSSSGVTCSPDLNSTSFFYKNTSERYTESQAKSNATTQAKRDASSKIDEIIRDRFKSEDAPKCLEDIQVSLEDSFAALYGTFGTLLPKQFKCSDGSTILTDDYLEQQAFDEEQAKKKPQYDEKYTEFYKEESEKLDKKINDCLDSQSQGN